MVGHESARLNGAPAPEPSDEVLAAQAAGLADTAAYATLVRRHQRRIYYLLLRFTRDPALAEDLCQETLLRAWRKLGTFDGRGSFAGWLARLCYHVFLAERRLARHKAWAASAALDDVDEPVAAPHGSDEVPDLDRLLSVVSPAEQQLLILNYAAGLSAAEIGDTLGLAPGTVKSQIHRAKQKIRQHFAVGDAHD